MIYIAAARRRREAARPPRREVERPRSSAAALQRRVHRRAQNGRSRVPAACPSSRGEIVAGRPPGGCAAGRRRACGRTRARQAAGRAARREDENPVSISRRLPPAFRLFADHLAILALPDRPLRLISANHLPPRPERPPRPAQAGRPLSRTNLRGRARSRASNGTRARALVYGALTLPQPPPTASLVPSVSAVDPLHSKGTYHSLPSLVSSMVENHA